MKRKINQNIWALNSTDKRLSKSITDKQLQKEEVYNFLEVLVEFAADKTKSINQRDTSGVLFRKWNVLYKEKFGENCNLKLSF